MTASDWLYAALLALHLAAGIALAVKALGRARAAGELPLRADAGGRSREKPAPAGRRFLFFRAPEILFALATVLFLFSYIYATNANMDYVQRFMLARGAVRLAPDSHRERLAACLKFLPLLAVDGFAVAFFRLRDRALAKRLLGCRTALGVWALPLGIASGILYALSFPSFLRTAGMPILAYVCLVPLLLALWDCPTGWGVFYGTLAGTVQAMITNYWLGTFNLLTLQFITVITIAQYVPFMAVSLALLRRARGLGFLVFPAAWTAFDWLRSLGFLGYPWGMLGSSQYAVIPLIQASALTGVWGVTFLVTLASSAIAWYASGRLTGVRRGRACAIVCAAAFACALGGGGLRIWRADVDRAGVDVEESGQAGVSTDAGSMDAKATSAEAAAFRPRSVRLALVQQNTDPRKDDYREGFAVLRRLTDSVLAEKPDIVVWSETAFVPNIRRWSAEDPARGELPALVHDFLAYQKGMGTWLLTGNDDYSLTLENGQEKRLDYNGAVFFSPEGIRLDTYHKIHLVPFTEGFPYKRQLPGFYRFLQSFDAYLWEPGDRRVVFRHPRFAFATPICFEDVFPDDVRLFVKDGAEVILNISNDYWSLTEGEAMQHAANAVFRAVENARPLVRASASGLTCVVDPLGRIAARGPFFQQAALVVDLPLPPARRTPYTRLGDWFPASLAAAVGAALAALAAAGLVRKLLSRKEGTGRARPPRRTPWGRGRE